MTCLHNHDQILEFLRKIFLKGFQIYQNYLCALTSFQEDKELLLTPDAPVFMEYEPILAVAAGLAILDLTLRMVSTVDCLTGGLPSNTSALL